MIIRALVIAMGVALAVIAFLGFRLSAVDHARDDLRTFKEDVVHATRVAADKPMLAEDQVPLQISYLGQGVERLRYGLETCSNNAKRREKEFEEARKRYEQTNASLSAAARSTQESIDRLRARAAQAPATRECEVPFDILTELENM